MTVQQDAQNAEDSLRVEALPNDKLAEAVDLQAIVRETQITEVLDQLDRDLVGLAPVKTKIREIAALLLVDRVRRRLGLTTPPPSLHMSLTGNP